MENFELSSYYEFFSFDRFYIYLLKHKSVAFILLFRFNEKLFCSNNIADSLPDYHIRNEMSEVYWIAYFF